MLEAAVMAAQTAVGLMQHQVGGTALTARYPAAGRTGEHRRVAAAIEEDQALFAALQTLADALELEGQGRRELGVLRAKLGLAGLLLLFRDSHFACRSSPLLSLIVKSVNAQ